MRLMAAHVRALTFAFAAVFALAFAASSARTETKLADLNGTWTGSGSDRNSPFESAQATTCQTRIEADLSRMSTIMLCDHRDGTRKSVNLNIATTGNRLAGTLTEKIDAQGTSKLLSGTVSGEKTNDTASLHVSLPGTPGANVELRLLGLSSYTMQVSSFGFTLTNVTFVRAASASAH